MPRAGIFASARVASPPAGGDFYDDFNRADSTTGLGTSSSGHIWEANLGVYGISSNQARSVSTNDGLTMLDLGYTDMYVSTMASYVTNSWGPQIVARFEDADNLYWVEPDGTNGSVSLRRRLAGNMTPLQVSATGLFTYGTLTEFKLDVIEGGSGTELRVYVGGSLVIVYVDSAGDRPMGTRAGYRAGAAGSGSRVDNFSAGPAEGSVSGISAVTLLNGSLVRPTTSPYNLNVTMASAYSSERWLAVLATRFQSSLDPNIQLTVDGNGQTAVASLGDFTIDAWSKVWICQPTGSTASLDLAFDDTAAQVTSIVPVEIIRSGAPTLVDFEQSASAGLTTTVTSSLNGVVFGHALQSSATAPSGDFAVTLAGSTAGWYRWVTTPAYPATGASLSLDPVTNDAVLVSLI